jgi:magnesium transporter
MGELLEALEDVIIARPSPAAIGAIHAVKRDLITMRRAIWPLRETLALLSREASPLFHDETRLYLRDCHDHTVQIIELLESYREIASGLLDVYLSSASNRMNEIMKVLTVISTIFIPLSFIASVYGMNFDPTRSPWNMPELGWRYGYPFALGLMAGVAVTLLLFFRRRGWLGRGAGKGQGDANAGTNGQKPRNS